MWCLIWWYWCQMWNRWCDVWYGVLCRKHWAVVVICGMYNTLPLHRAPRYIIPPHFTLHHSTSNTVSDIDPKLRHIPRHTSIARHITHFILHQHLLQHTLFPFAIPYFKSHHIGHIMHHTTDVSHQLHPTFHVLHATYFRWRHILATSFMHHHISYHTTFYATLRRISCAPHLIPHPTTMVHITFHITHQYTTTFYIPPLVTSRITPPPLTRIAPCHSPHSTSFHTRATLHIPCLSTLPHSTSHNVLHSMPQHTTSFHAAQRSTFHATAHTPHSTPHNVPRSMPQPTHLIPHHTTFHVRSHSPHSTFHIAQRSTFHATAHTPPHSTSHNVPRSMPQYTLYLVSHHTTFHIACHSTRTTLYHTTTSHNPILVWETGNYMWSVLLCSFVHIQPFIPHIKPNTKVVVKKCNFIHKVPEKVIPICSFVLSGSVFNHNIAYLSTDKNMDDEKQTETQWAKNWNTHLWTVI